MRNLKIVLRKNPDMKYIIILKKKVERSHMEKMMKKEMRRIMNVLKVVQTKMS